MDYSIYKPNSHELKLIETIKSEFSPPTPSVTKINGDIQYAYTCQSCGSHAKPLMISSCKSQCIVCKRVSTGCGD